MIPGKEIKQRKRILKKKIFVCAAMFSGYAKKKTGYIFPGMVYPDFYLIKKSMKDYCFKLGKEKNFCAYG